jgi:phospholipid N-methyltransferase
MVRARLVHCVHCAGVSTVWPSSVTMKRRILALKKLRSAGVRKIPGRRRANQLWTFLRGFVRNPVMVGSVIPSSELLTKKMLATVDWSACNVFVEYGPGVGTFTASILDKLKPDGRFLAIETNPDFVKHLKESFVDPRLEVILDSALNVRSILGDRQLECADYILSGLPFSTLPPGVGPKIASETATALRPGGCFLVYQFSPKVHDFLKPYFTRIDRGFEVRNVPPASLFWAWKDVENVV